MKHVLLCFALIIHFSAIAQTNNSFSGTEQKKDLGPEYKYIWSKAQSTGRSIKKQLDFSAIDNWVFLNPNYQSLISNDGKYFTYSIKNKPGKCNTLVIQSVAGDWKEEISCIEVQEAFFPLDNKQFLFKANDELHFLTLGKNSHRIIKDITSFQREGDKWIAFLKKDGALTLQDLVSGFQKQFKNVSYYAFDKTSQSLAIQFSDVEKTLLIYQLNSGKEFKYMSVTSYGFTGKNNEILLKTLIDGQDGLEIVNFAAASKVKIWAPEHKQQRIEQYLFDSDGEQVVFLIQDEQQGITENSLWYYKAGMGKAACRVTRRSNGIAPGLHIDNIMGFTPDSNYILFTLKANEDKHESSSDVAQLDVWNYKDTIIRSAQSNQFSPKIYTAILNVSNPNSKVLQLKEYEKIKNLKGGYALVAFIGEDANGDRFWEGNFKGDSNWLVSLKDGSRTLLKTRASVWNIDFSPGGKYILYFKAEEKCNYFTYELATGKVVNISVSLPEFTLGSVNKNVYGAKPIDPVGIVAWLKDDSAVLVYDNYDIWQLDPAGKKAPVCVTNGYGKRNKIQLKLAPQYGLSERTELVGTESLLLIASNEQNKYCGYCRIQLGKRGNPEMLSMQPFKISGVVKAKSVDTWILQRETADAGCNFYSTNNFKTFTALTNFQFHNNYNWLSAELIRFQQEKNILTAGILYKPQDFDPAKKYPVIINIEKQVSDGIYDFLQPNYTSDAITDVPWFVSHGYLVFLPDIYFFKGKRPESALCTVQAAVRVLSEMSYVDKYRIALSGHSQAGALTNYIITHTNSFAAVFEGAGTSDYISSGLQLKNSNKSGPSRLTHVEGEQAVSIWQNPKSWINKSAVLNADKVTSPLLIFHCKNDEAVPFEQGVAIFTSLRRLNKKAWMLQYDGGGHNLSDVDQEKDLTIRVSQYFDHYLKDAPASKWMTEGVPAYLKGVESGLEFDPNGSCAMQDKTHCYICEAWNKQYKRTPAMFEKEIKYWELDKDLKEELDRKTKAERTKLDKEQLVEDKKM